ncbi:MAG: nucleotide exchange factor GrpE [Halobacteriaceae archaeon]
MAEEAADTSESAAEEAGPDVDALAAEVAAYDESLGEAVASAGRELEAVRRERESLAEEVEELTDRVQRVQADFQNYKKRADRKQEEIRERATEDLVERLLEVRDNLERALEQDVDADVRDGVEATLREFDRVLDDEGVERIDPDEGAAVDPRRHEVVHREAEDAEAISSVYRPGYAMAEKVLRPAQVTVGPDSEADEESEEST